LIFILVLSSAKTLHLNSRHVIFLKDFANVKGSSFYSTFYSVFEETHQEIEPRVAFFRINDASVGPQELAFQRQQQLQRQDGLSLNCSQSYDLRELNPLELEKQLGLFQPSILWIHQNDASSQCNSFALRYYLRTSGLDRYIEENCGADNGVPCQLFVGEGVSPAACAGESMDIAHALQHDPKGAPEPQFRGLGILDKSVLYGKCQCLDQKNDNQLDVTIVDDEQVFVWSQTRGLARSLILNAQNPDSSRTSWQDKEPLPPMVEVDLGGRKCIGEPSIDPSRRIQLSQDLEWMEEEGFC